MVGKIRRSSPVLSSLGQTEGDRVLTQQLPGSTHSILSDSDRKLVSDSINTTLVSLQLFGFDSNGYKVSPTLHHWFECAARAGSALKFLKWKFSSFYSSAKTNFFNDPQDIAPLANVYDPENGCEFDSPHFLLGGRAYRFIRAFAKKSFHDGTTKFDSWVTTALQMKKGITHPGPDYLSAAIDTTFNELTTEPSKERSAPRWIRQWSHPLIDTESASYASENNYLTREAMEAQFRRTVHDVFKDSKFTMSDRVDAFMPSTSANYINSRSAGGAVGAIISDDELMRDLKYTQSQIHINQIPLPSRNDPTATMYTVEYDGLVRSFNTLYHRMVVKTLDEDPVAVPLALAEALKVRVITKGPPLLNTVLKPLQKFLWKTIRKHPSFSLVGEWLSIEYLQSMLGTVLKDDETFLSVDYQNATNEMFSWVSESIANAIADESGMDGVERMLFIRALTRHLIEHPVSGAQSPQKTGQLMGSIVSFPVLCLANAAILRFSKELTYNRKMSLKRAGVVVNGDDGLIKTRSAEGHDIWAKIASFCGLGPSIGKVYKSRHFFNINSTTFNFHQDGWECRPLVILRESTPIFGVDEPRTVVVDGTVRPVLKPTRMIRVWTSPITTERPEPTVLHYSHVKYVNLALLYGYDRASSATTTGAPPSSVGARANELMRLCPDCVRIPVMNFFMSKNLEILTSMNVPWFIPESLGGMGLPMTEDLRHRPTDQQLRIARKIYEHPDKYRVPTLSQGGVWQTWRLANKVIPDQLFPHDKIISSSNLVPKVVQLDDEVGKFVDADGMAEYHNVAAPRSEPVEVLSLVALRNLAVAECLFTRTLDELLTEQVDKFSLETNYYRRLHNLNKRALYDQSIPLPQPFALRRLNRLPKSVSVDIVPFCLREHDEDTTHDSLLVSSIGRFERPRLLRVTVEASDYEISIL